jgi:hypothetical protein
MMRYEVSIAFPPTIPVEQVEALWEFDLRVSNYAVTIFSINQSPDTFCTTSVLMNEVKTALWEAGERVPTEYVIHAKELYDS